MNRRTIRLITLLIVLSLAIPLLQSNLSTTLPVEAQGAVQARVAVDTLIVRQAPGINARIIGEFNLDTVLNIQGREDNLGNGGIWVYGSPAQGGVTGWVLSDYLAFPSDFNRESLPVINAQGVGGGATPSGGGSTPVGGGNGQTLATVNFRSGPGLTYQVLRTLNAGTSVDFVGRNPDATWAYGSVGGQQGWLYYTLIQIPGGVSTLPVIQGQNQAPAAQNAPVPEGTMPGITTAAVNFRSGPTTSSGIIRTLPSGTAAGFIGRDANSRWFKAVVGGQEGWLYYTLVNISGNVGSLPVLAGEVASPSGGGAVGAPPPAYSAASLGTFSYGAHIANFGGTERMREAGMTWVKVQVRYGRGSDPGSVAGLINEAHNNGFRILLGVVGYPNDVLAGQSYFNDYASFVGGAAALGADAIEVWNEPNLDREWPNGNIDPGLYTQLLATAYNGIKSRNPGTIVISAAPAPTGAEGAFGRAAVWNDNAYVAGMRDAGAARYMDCLGAHYNEGIISPYSRSGDPRDPYYTRYYWGMVNTYASLINKPICFTELGYLTPEGYGGLPGGFSWASNVTLAQQAQWIRDVIVISRSSGRVKLVIIWNFNFSGGGADPMGGYAMLRPDGSCPACDRLAGR